MTNENSINELESTTATVEQIRRISPFWLLPFIALCIGAFLFFQIIKQQGEIITIRFQSGDGLVANKTQVQYQGLQIGTVQKVKFTSDLKNVEVTATIYPEAKTLLRKGTKFWVVKPTASLAGVSGLETLVSGNYITLQPGKGEYEDEFIAEMDRPIAEMRDGDLLVHLIADDLGDMTVGAPVYYKKLEVGKVADYHFTADQKNIEIDLVINKNYANLVKKDTHFWNMSGIQASLNGEGLSIKMGTLASIVGGGIAFDSPAKSAVAEQNQRYKLYSDLKAAGRGIVVDVTLPTALGLEVNKTVVYYQNMAVGILYELEAENPYLDKKIKGKLLIDPNMSALLKTDSIIVLNDKKPSLTDLNVNTLFRGVYLEIIAGSGQAKRDFNVIQHSQLLLNSPNTLVVTLNSPSTYGVEVGQPLYYNGMIIGEIARQDLSVNGVQFKAAIMGDFRSIVNQDTQFIAASNIDMSLNVDGLHMTAASPETWLKGGVRVISKNDKKGTVLEHYPLYKNMDNAQFGIISEQLTPTITLTTNQLPSIAQGALVLYRQYEVGKIIDVRPTSKNFQVDVFIYPKYRHLLTEKSLFWVESAAKIDITPKGISIQASPVARTLKGAISFDNSGSGSKVLYANELYAKSAGNKITLTTGDATNLSKGMSLRYMGLTIGEIEQINLENNGIVVKALINPEYMKMIARENSVFKVISPQVSAGAIENLDALLQPYIDVTAGNGERKKQFVLIQASENPHRFNGGFPITLEASNALNLTTGAPVLYRGVEVGIIDKMELNEMGDRVLIHLLILPKFQYLVRKNSEFWVSSGYNFELGWKGAEFSTGSVQQFLKGGVSFSNPSGAVVQPQADPNQRFLLQIKQPSNEPDWNQGVMSAQ